MSPLALSTASTPPQAESVSVGAFPAPAAGPRSLSWRRLLQAYLSEARYESIRSLRMPAFAIPFLLLPAALYLLFGALLFAAALRADPKGAAWMFVSWGIFGVMGPGLFGFGVFVATEREQGLLRLKRAQPMPPAAYLLAKGGMALLFAVLIVISLVAAARLVTHPPLSLARMLLVSAVEVLGSLPFCALGLFLGTRVSAKAAPALVNLIYLPMIYLSGFLLPLPKSIQAIALVSPAFHLDQLALRAAGLPTIGGALGHLAFLLGFTLLLGWLALRRLARMSL